MAGARPPEGERRAPGTAEKKSLADGAAGKSFGIAAVVGLVDIAPDMAAGWAARRIPEADIAVADIGLFRSQ